MFVVGYKPPTSRRIATQVTRLAPQARLMTQRGESARLSINFVRPHRATIEAEALAHGKQELAARIEGQKRGVGFGDGVQQRKLAAQRVLLEDVNAGGPA